jgi:hypothetical protein
VEITGFDFGVLICFVPDSMARGGQWVGPAVCNKKYKVFQSDVSEM